ncbi:MAG TPA: DMT family transporter [Polyangiaceae bacterium]
MILEVATAVGGAYTLLVIGKQIRGRFWRTTSGRRRMPRDYAAGAFLAFICALLWALSYVSLKFVSARVPGVPLTAAVIGAAAIFLILGQALARWFEAARALPPERMRPRLGGNLLALCLANLGNFGLSIAALYFVSASHAMALNNASPLFLAALLVVRQKLRITCGSATAILVVLLGAWLLAARGDAGEASFVGSGLALAAGCCFAIWADLADDFEARLDRMSTRLGLLARVFALTSGVAAAATWFSETLGQPSLTDALLIAGNGLRVAIVYVVFQLAVRRGGPLLAVVVSILQVPLTLVSEALLLGAAVDARLAIGVAAAFAGAISLCIDQARQDAAAPGRERRAPHDD